LLSPLPLLPLPLASLSPASLVAITITHIIAFANTIALIAIARLSPSLPLLLPPLPLPSLLHATLVANAMAHATLTLFIARHPHCCHHQPCHAIIICHMLSAFIIACHRGQVVVDALLPATTCL
jgi:hypothetical protein